MYWSLGRITKVFPGADGKVRVVEVKTKHQERLTRLSRQSEKKDVFPSEVGVTPFCRLAVPATRGPPASCARAEEARRQKPRVTYIWADSRTASYQLSGTDTLQQEKTWFNVPAIEHELNSIQL
ncbi:hypothetical protein LAZ67_8001668 [Cordylochernes scorpioides]|uniref:DUF5641 domain-containing protein n=1 Tax=Cordylochernes scorpioides TaxID=51811 RepID=A0ABY6KQG1_9ARAC|nr:hypothetical protein LAZ67_8001668 [Cordylochernes scorpioides]